MIDDTDKHKCIQGKGKTRWIDGSLEKLSAVPYAI